MSQSHKGMLYILIVLAFLISIYFSSSLKFASASLPVNLTLNTSQVWWRDGVNASGYTNATTAVTVFQGSSQICSVTSAASGFWSCAFSAPTSIGIFAYTANTSSTDISGTATLNDFPFFGVKAIGNEPRVVYEVPFLMQDLNGNIQKIFVRVNVAK